MKYNYPYLKDSSFLLNDVFQSQNIEQMVRFTVLTFNEKPIKNISGRVTGGSITMDRTSSTRRVMNLTAFIEEKDSSYMEIGGLFSLNKKIKVEIGLKNTTEKFTEYPILWFPMGVYIIMGLYSTHGTGGTTVNLTLKDKMVFLNGECGGTFPAAVTLHEHDEIDSATGAYYLDKPTISQIIKEVVHHYGGEAIENIVVNDIDEKVKQVMRWTPKDKTDKLRFWYEKEKGTYHFAQVKEEEYNQSNFDDDIAVFKYGDDVGFIYSKFYYPGSEGLIANAGESVCTVLDKIKNVLGNFEYFYDLNGNFVFQEIKNYLNKTKSSTELQNYFKKDSPISSKDFYLSSKRRGEALYDLNNNHIITSFTNNPQYNNVKNDFVVWGVRESAAGKKVNIRYHLAIDKKPEISIDPSTGESASLLTYFQKDPKDGILKNKLPIEYESSRLFPKVGQEGRVYATSMSLKTDPDVKVQGLFCWDPNGQYEYCHLENGLQMYSDEYYDISNSEIVIRNIEKEKCEISQYKGQDENIEMPSFDSSYVELLDNNNSYTTASFSMYKIDSDGRASEELTSQISFAKRKDGFEKEIPFLAITYEDEDGSIYNYYAPPIAVDIKSGTPVSEVGGDVKIEANSYIYKFEASNLYGDKEYITKDDLKAEGEDSYKYTIIMIKNGNDIVVELKEIGEDSKSNISKVVEKHLADKEEVDVENMESFWKVTGAKQFFFSHYRFLGLGQQYLQVQDWRTQLYIEGSQGSRFGTESNYYYPELVNEWGKIFTLESQEEGDNVIYKDRYQKDVYNYPDQLDYFLDIVDGEGSNLAEFSVQNIGRRTKVVNDDKVNCIFEPIIPDFIIIENKDDYTTKTLIEECRDREQKYIVVDDSILYENLSVGGTKNSAYNVVRDLLYQHTHYNETCTVNVLPLYFLEPNMRISLRDDVSGIKGDYMISTISIPLDINGTMSLSCIKALERI